MRFLILALTVISTLAFADTAKPAQRIAVIELEKLVNDVDDGQSAKTKLQ